MMAGQKKSLNIELDHTDAAGELMGYETINLNNAAGDETIMREPLYFNVMRQYTVCPAGALVKLYINNAYWGVYSLAQQGDSDLVSEWFPSKDGDRWRAPNIATGGGGGGGGGGSGVFSGSGSGCGLGWGLGGSGCGVGGGETGELPSAQSSTWTGPGFSVCQFTPKIRATSSSRCTATARISEFRLSLLGGVAGGPLRCRIMGGVMCGACRPGRRMAAR